MEYIDNEQGEEIQDSTPVAPDRTRKKKFIKFLVIVLAVFVFIGAAAFAYVTILRSSPQIRNISKDALIVAKIDIPKLILKADIQEIQKDSADDNLRETLEDLNMEALIDDPKSTGLITAKPSYYFLEFDAKKESIIQYIVMPIASGEKLQKFLKGISTPDEKDLEINHKGGKYSIENDDIACAWNKNTLIIGFTEETDPDDILKSAQTYLDQPKSKSIAANATYKKAPIGSHDAMVWLNTDAIATIAEKGFKNAKPRVKELIAQRREYDKARESYNAALDAYQQQIEDYYYGDNYYYDYNPPEFTMQEPDVQMSYPKGIFEEMLFSLTYYSSRDGSSSYLDEVIDQFTELKGTSLLGYVDFEKGKVVTGVKSTLTSAQIKKYKGMFSNLADIKNLAKFLPQDGLVGTLAFQFNWSEFWKISEKPLKHYLDQFSGDDKDAERYTKHLKNLFDGTMYASLNVGTGKEKTPFFTLASSTKKNNGVQNIIKELDKDDSYLKNGKVYKNASEYGRDAFIMEDGVVIWTSNYTQYKKCDYGLAAKELNKVSSKPFGVFFDMIQLLELAGDNLDKDAEDILEEIANISLKAKSHKGFPDEYIAQVTMKDKKQNSLKVLWDMIPDKDEMFQGFVPQKREQVLEESFGEDEYYNGYADTSVTYPSTGYDSSY